MRLRDLNVQRLKHALSSAGLPEPLRVVGQGGYAMHTLTQRFDGDQDIDVAVVFRARDLGGLDALRLRSCVHDAVLSAAPDSFARPPERRTNAVTVWYSGGWHIDFALYRDTNGVLEHAGSRWVGSDPGATVRWFQACNRELSPSWRGHQSVPDNQLRRVVRMLKYLRHLDDGDHPGGFIVVALGVKYYQESALGDDVALYQTMTAIVRGLGRSLDVANPLVRGQSLTWRVVDQRRLDNYRLKLEDMLRDLRPLAGRRNVQDPVSYWEDALEFSL